MPRWLAGQFVIWGVGFALLRVFVVPAERCPSVDAGAVRGAIDGATAWLVRNQQADGRFLYGYHRADRRVAGLQTRGTAECWTSCTGSANRAADKGLA